MLSGFARCGRCGGRYQGVTRTKGKRRVDGTKVKTRSYACGSYVARGRSACEFGAVSQGKLERAVVDAVLAFYDERYGGDDGPKNLAIAVRDQLGHESKEIAHAREKLEAERRELESTMNNLLDNLTPGTSDLIEPRLRDLRRQRSRLERQSEELDRIELKDTQIRDTTEELQTFLADLQTLLRGGPNERRMAALRRCVDRITITRADEPIQLAINLLPLTRPVESEGVAKIVTVEVANGREAKRHTKWEASSFGRTGIHTATSGSIDILL